MAETGKEIKLSAMENLRTCLAGYRLMARLTPKFLWATGALSLVNALAPLVVLFFSARILNELAGAQVLSSILLYASLAVGLSFTLAVIKAFATRIQDVYGNYTAFLHMLDAEAEQFTQMDYPHAENNRLFEMLADMDTKARGNSLGLMNLYHHTLPVLQNLFSLALSAALLAGLFRPQAGYTQNFFTSPWTLAIIAGLLAMMLIMIALIHKRQQRLMEEVVGSNAKANSNAWYYSKYILADQAAKDIRLYGQREALNEIFEESFSMKSWRRFFDTLGRHGAFESALMAFVGGCVYLVIGLRALAGMYAIGDVTQYVGAVTALAMAAGALVSSVGEIYNNGPFLKPLLDYLALPDALAKGARPVHPPRDGGYEFEFQNVSFAYPGTEEYTIRDLSFKINTGERLAVVGLNGSGKTTMIKLLCRLYDPTLGAILLDGVDIREYDYDQYHALFSVVFQDFTLFPLPLNQNVAASEAVDAARAERALRDAGFEGRLTTMPEGLDTVLYKAFDENGVQISGGEAQKIALARALYKDAQFIILDEPTAALDPIAEYEVYTTFDRTIGQKTAIFISHRLSSCRFCDDIAVFDAGRIVQRGDHDALLADAGGRYAQLWHAQAQHYVDQEVV